MRRSTFLFTLMMGLLLVLVSAALWWRVDSEIRHFSSYQQQLMNRQATLSVSRINRLVSSLRNRMIAVSLDARWLQDLEHYGSIDAMQRSLSERFRLYFPEMSAFTISNAQGEQLWGDLDFLDSESCRADLENTAAMLTHKTSYFEYQPRIHDKPGNHHFDMMFPVFWSQQKLVLFMSFKAQLLSQVLQENRISDHFTYLLREDRPGLIEVSLQGDRENLVRDFFLQPGELQSVTAQEPVPYTRWEVAVIENPTVVSRFKATIYRDAWIAWGLFMVLWGSLLWLALKYERDQGHLFNRLNHLSMHDELTGLANRRQLIRMLKRALEDLHHPNIHNALLYMDLNNFKPVNDRYGHDVGDQLLIAFSERLQQCIRQQDLAVRLGGDEFVILIRELAGTRQDAQKVLKETEKRCYQSLSRPYRIGGHLIESPPSIGTVLITPEMDDVDDLIKAGDLAMYRAKHRQKSSSGGTFPDAEGFT